MAIASHYYICNRCRFRTTQLSKVNDHQMVHIDTMQPLHSPLSCFHTLKPWKCPSCDFSTESLVLLRYHVVHNHDQQQFALKATLKTCKKCGFWTHSNYLWIRHRLFGSCKDKKGSEVKRNRENILMKRDGKWYLCEKCDYRSVNSRDVKNHVISKHTPLEDIDWQQCNKCMMKYKTPDTLRKHNCHMSAEDPLHCTECDYFTPSRYSLTVHFNRKHTPSEEINWVECHECGGKFKDKDLLKKHLVRHTTKDKQYKCDQCPFETHESRSLKNHIVNRHSKNEDIKMYDCEQCDYKSHSKTYLTKHITRMHRQTKFNCENCSFVTKTEKLLQSHMFKKHTDHTGEEKFHCSHCTYLSFKKKNLKQHLTFKHKIDDNKRRWYECDKCDYKNRDNRSLMGHMYRVHNDAKLFECDQCIYKTGSQYAMQHHKKNHKMKKCIRKIVSEKFECYICGFTTDQKSLIKTHITKNHLKTKMKKTDK